MSSNSLCLNIKYLKKGGGSGMPEPPPWRVIAYMRATSLLLGGYRAVRRDVRDGLPAGHGHRLAGGDVVLAAVGVPLGAVRERDRHLGALGVRDRETVPASARLLQDGAVTGLLHGRVHPVVRLHGRPRGIRLVPHRHRLRGRAIRGLERYPAVRDRHDSPGADVVLAAVGVPLGAVRERDRHLSPLGVRDGELVPSAARGLQLDAMTCGLGGGVHPVVRLHGLP